MILITGAAGFIGYHTAKALLEQGETVIGIDNLNGYYDPILKCERVKRLDAYKNFDLCAVDLTDKESLEGIVKSNKITHVIHLAAQAGVRYSIQNPDAYVQSNIVGYVNLLEACKNAELSNFIYASSSSVYGANTKLPFAVHDRTDSPVSFYGATKKAMEAISYSYWHLYKMPLTGFRFFTVYGPWGRPDMAYYSFTKKILSGEKIQIFNNGDMSRDFTYIDDIVGGLIQALYLPQREHLVFNLGNCRSERLMDFVSVISDTLGVKAKIEFQPMQPGDVKDTYADIEATRRAFGFRPTTSIQTGIPKFVDWYKRYYNIK